MSTDFDFRPVRVLLVEDDEDDYVLTRDLLAESRHMRFKLDWVSSYDEALRESEERYALSARGANDGLWVWDLRANSVYYSPRWKSMIGYEEEDIGDSPEEWFSRVHPDDLQLLQAAIASHRDGLSTHLES